MFAFLRRWFFRIKNRAFFKELHAAVEATKKMESLKRNDCSYNEYLQLHFQSRQNAELEHVNTERR